MQLDVELSHPANASYTSANFQWTNCKEWHMPATSTVLLEIWIVFSPWILVQWHWTDRQKAINLSPLCISTSMLNKTREVTRDQRCWTPLNILREDLGSSSWTSITHALYDCFFISITILLHTMAMLLESRKQLLEIIVRYTVYLLLVTDFYFLLIFNVISNIARWNHTTDYSPTFYRKRTKSFQ